VSPLSNGPTNYKGEVRLWREAAEVTENTEDTKDTKDLGDTEGKENTEMFRLLEPRRRTLLIEALAFHPFDGPPTVVLRVLYVLCVLWVLCVLRGRRETGELLTPAAGRPRTPG
jgi:hypothetical protein